jgi:hypothetical protein
MAIAPQSPLRMPHLKMRDELLKASYSLHPLQLRSTHETSQEIYAAGELM